MDGAVNIVGLARWLWRYKSAILIAQAIAISAAAIFTSPYFMRPMYKSYAVIMPTNSAVENDQSAADILSEYLKSVDIKNEVIKRMNLIKYYKIDTNKRYWYSQLLQLYDKRIGIDINTYENIKITAIDANPDTACMLVNAVINECNDKILAVNKERAIELEASYKKQLELKQKRIDSLASLAKALSVQYGIVDYAGQSREIERAYYQMLASSRTGNPMDETALQIKNMEEKGIEYKEVSQHLEAAVKTYDETLAKYEDAVKDANTKLTYTSVISHPYPDDKKASPVRSVIVVLTSLSVFIFTLLVLRFIEKIKQ